MLHASPRPVQSAWHRFRTWSVACLPASSGSDHGTSEPSTGWTSPPPPVPPGIDLEDLERAFRSWRVNDEPAGHLDPYVDDSIYRFLHTWGIVRDLEGSGLELGANPYFTTYLLQGFTGLDLQFANYYGRRGETTETVSFVPPDAIDRKEITFRSRMFNVEEDEFPYDSGSFDVVLFCEMIEHLLMNPLFTLGQIHRVLKPGGVLVVTTPNVARLGNVLAVVNGANIYDPYSGFGPYGRHNREYTRHDLHRLLDFAGFDIDLSFTADGHEWNVTDWPRHAGLAPLVEFRRPDLGQYLFVRARATRPPRSGLPSFLYRSWPASEIVEFQ
jgi:SAM-dependent methyltransferase